MRAALVAGAMTGVALAIGLVIYFGADAVTGALAAAGWRGLTLMVIANLVSLLLCAAAWRALLIEPLPHSGRVFVWARFVRDSLGNLIGVIPATGELAAARELTLHGLRAGAAGATAIVDVTAELLSQVIFTLIGFMLLLVNGHDSPLTNWLIGGIAIAAAAVIGFIVAQRRGMFHVLETLPDRMGITSAWKTLPDGEWLHDSISAIYDQPWRLPVSFSLHLLAWLVAAFETQIGLQAMGHPLPFADCVALESLVFAARTSAFVVPWAAGIQEGGYVLIGGMLGLSPGVGLALSLLKRARELIVGAPGLMAWHGVESRRMLARRTLSDAGDPGNGR